jgi:PBSX family phage terminase large subunit
MTSPVVSAIPRLSEKQERTIAHSSARINLWTGAIRSGKTISSLLRWLIYIADAPHSGLLVCSSKTLDTAARNIFGPLMDPAITGPAASLVRYTRGASTATILGRQVEVITANDARAEARLRGLTCAGAYVDELSLIPEAFVDQLLGRMSVPNSMLFGSSNPDNPTHWLRKRFILRAGELNLRHWHFVLEDNPGLTPEYIAAIKREMTGIYFKRFVEGLWVLAEGAVFDMWDEDRHVVDELPLMRRWLAVGIDHGTRNPFHAVLLGLGVDGRLYIAAEWRWDSEAKRRQMTDAEYSREVRAWLGRIEVPGAKGLVGVMPEMIVVDPSATGFRVQMYQDGFTPRLADNEVLPGIRTMSTLLGLDLLRVHRSCTGLLDELPGYSWDDTKAEKGLDEPIKVDDHGIDAARYGIRTSRALWLPHLREKLTLAT